MTRLATVLRVRELEERRARGQLGEAIREVAQAERRVQEEEGHDRVSTRATDIAQLRTHVGAATALHERRQAALHDLEEARALRASREDTWSRSAARARAVQRLTETRAAAARVAAEKREAALLDELFLTRGTWR